MITIQIDDADRQAILLALARLSLERPGWVWYLGEIAEHFQARAMYDGFRNLTADLSTPPVPSDRIDRVELHGGVAHLPAEFREIARLANDAGMAGHEFLDAEVGMEIPADLEDIRTCVKITYRRR